MATTTGVLETASGSAKRRPSNKATRLIQGQGGGDCAAQAGPRRLRGGCSRTSGASYQAAHAGPGRRRRDCSGTAISRSPAAHSGPGSGDGQARWRRRARVTRRLSWSRAGCEPVDGEHEQFSSTARAAAAATGVLDDDERAPPGGSFRAGRRRRSSPMTASARHPAAKPGPGRRRRGLMTASARKSAPRTGPGGPGRRRQGSAITAKVHRPAALLGPGRRRPGFPATRKLDEGKRATRRLSPSQSGPW